MSKNIYLGNGKLHFLSESVTLKEVNRNNERYYKIENIGAMRPFFMSIVSNSNHWMFISSNGALTAGRKNSEHALFPYYTDDKITESLETTGSKTLMLVTKNEKTHLWEPFSEKQSGVYEIEQNLYKNAYGNKVIFEEINRDLGMAFSYEWNSSDHFGFIRKAVIKNTSEQTMQIELVDGLQNILPYGVGEDLQKASSNLVDAYKKSELHPESRVGIYALSAIIVDRAEPSEALKANVVWSNGLKGATTLLSSAQLDRFRRGISPTQEEEVKAEKGAYFLSKKIRLKPNETENWQIIANVNQTISQIVALEETIKSDQIDQLLDQDIEAGTIELLQLVGAADGLHLTEDQRINDRHFANTMFNIMRGGIFDANYTIEKEDFIPYIRKANKDVYKEKKQILEDLDPSFSLEKLLHLGEQDDNLHFSRLCFEYLPLKFSRRHGDPSRPWNKFSINTKNEIDGSKILDYQGNWRDIFQNWEALAHAYPRFIQGMIHKFLNATTFDGYNPYRVTKDGFDWETVEANNPWSYIGYWGDHQIIYLLKFLEFIENYYPDKLQEYFSQECFVYANVPYQIKPYKDMVIDPKNTILYDHESEDNIFQRRSALGADGALLTNFKAQIHQVNFIEKILATILAKLANFVPEAGIWLNTQRPEWNDANNALVGNGVSMVTLYYLRRFLAFLDKLLLKSDETFFSVSVEIYTLYHSIHAVFNAHKNRLGSSFSDQQRKQVMDALGQAVSQYRGEIYTKGFKGEKKELDKDVLAEFIQTALSFLEDAIRKNKRSDNLYHAYNLISFKGKDAVSVDYLPEMLEGQVAVLSSDFLNAKENLEVLDALRKSKLYREDQQSYILYPNKELPKFNKKNTIPKDKVLASPLLQDMLEKGDQSIISKDVIGHYHFNGNFRNAADLNNALNQIGDRYSSLITSEKDTLMEIFEEVFNHKAFTGRSGTFFGYEGLGSIYWHMVSKLALAAYEITLNAIIQKENEKLVEKLSEHFHEIVAGIGAHKTPEVYGAFPTDPYSHTPGGKGAQQPGMTGQVKEDIISRFGALGLRIEKGTIHFDTSLLKEDEYLKKPHDFSYFNVLGEHKTITLQKDSLVYTYCQVPVVYRQGDNQNIEVFYQNGKTLQLDGNSLDLENSNALFDRTNSIEKITVTTLK